MLLCSITLCTTPNMDQWRQRAELSEKLRKKIIGISVKGQGYRTIFKQLHVPMATVSVIIKKYNAHWTVVSLTGHGCKRKSQVDHKDSSDGRKRSKETKLSSKVKVHHCLCTMYYDIIYIYFNDDLHGRRCRKNTKKPSWKSPEHMLTSPNVFGRMSKQNWSFLVHPHPLTFYRRKNEALKENLEPVQGTSLKTTQASWSETYCRVSESSAWVRGHGLKNTEIQEWLRKKMDYF